MSASLRFVDTSVFVHAYLKPKRVLKPSEVLIKEAARKIVTRINRGERVFTTVVHFGEMANILEDYLSVSDALNVERALCLRENVEIVTVTHEDYVAALDAAENEMVGLNDALALVAMKKHGVDELYSFDRDFDRLKNVKRLRT